jgi:hypothetical protein
VNRTTAIQRLAILRKAEWIWVYDGCRCPSCCADEEHGHTPACKMAAFIADVEDDVKAERDRRELRARHKRERSVGESKRR